MKSRANQVIISKHQTVMSMARQVKCQNMIWDENENNGNTNNELVGQIISDVLTWEQMKDDYSTGKEIRFIIDIISLVWKHRIVLTIYLLFYVHFITVNNTAI